MKNGLFKRLISAVLCVCTLITLIPTGVLASDTPTVIYGDADGNGAVELDDVLAVERYVEGSDVQIDTAAADVNSDGVVDEADSLLLREYLVGNTTLPVKTYTLTFDTGDGDVIAPIQVGAGCAWRGTIPSPASPSGYFTGWTKPDGTAYYQNEIITGDMTLTAVYGGMPNRQALSVDSFALTNREPYLTFDIESSVYSTQQEAAAHVSLAVKDGSAPVRLQIIGSNGRFMISAPEGFNRGCSYELTLDEGVNFAGKDKMYRRATFTINREEVDRLKYNENLIFIKDTEGMVYTVDGRDIDVLEASFLNNGTDNRDITGVFTMRGGKLKVGDYVCIYEKLDPRDRDYTDNTYEDDALAYIQITGINNGEYSFRSLNDGDVENVLLMPTTIPFRVKTLPDGNTAGSVNGNNYDADAWSKMNNPGAPDYDLGDIIVFYTVSLAEFSEDTACRYAKVTGVDGDTVSYLVFPDGYSREDLEDYIIQEFFVSLEVDSAEIVNELNEEDRSKLLANIAEQARSGGFAAESMNSMIKSALETPSVLEQLRENGLTAEEIEELKSETLQLNGPNIAVMTSAAGAGKSGRVMFTVEGFSVTPTFMVGERYDRSAGVLLEISVVLSIEKKMSPTKTIALKLEINAGFEQQVGVALDVGVDMDVEWYAFVPVVNRFTVKTTFDIKTYTSLSISVKMFTVQDTISKKKWTAYTDATATPGVQNALRRINRLAVLAKRAQKSLEAAETYLEQIQDIKEMLPKFMIGDEEYSIDRLLEELGVSDVSGEFDEVLSAEDETGFKVGVEQLMDKYNEMLDTECDWVDLFNQVLFEKEFHIKIVAIKLTVSFIVRAKVNILIGADIEYEAGKRYSFWIDIRNAKSGSDEMDLLDERFGFQFYVMGMIGIKAGVKLEVAVGFITTKLGSVGANVEVGPYLKLYGYFFYIFTRLRPANTQDWQVTEEMQGAMYIDFGIYLTVKFKAQVFDNMFKYEPTLFDREFPLLIAGVRANVYDFATRVGKDDILYINDTDADSFNGINMSLPQSYLSMRTMDMVTGDREQAIYTQDNFNIRFTDSRFSIDNSGVISVKPDGNERYIACEMSVTWICDKLAFSKYDIDITVPVIWTLMSDSERTEKFTASVAVGSANDGYSVVWSDSFTRLDVFDLPSAEEILGLIRYDSYNYNDTENLKYGAVPGYGTAQTEDLQILGDTTFYFDIMLREYSVTVYGIQNPGGGLSSRTFTAHYGHDFNFTELAGTGADDPANNNYTAYKSLASRDYTDSDFSGDLTADLSFYLLFGDSAEFDAVYIDEARTATFNFMGIIAESVSVQFRRGTIPDMTWITDYVTVNGGSGAIVTEISPAVRAAEVSTSYLVSCFVDVPAPMHTLHFVSRHPLSIEDRQYQEGSIIFRPSDPAVSGYEFGGWYTDDTLLEAFDFNGKMPANDLTLYARWINSGYEVTLTSQGATFDTVSVTYDTAVDFNDPPKQDDVFFAGWFTEPDGGTEISDGDIWNIPYNTELFAHWEAKAAVELSTAATYTAQQSATYDENTHSFTVTDNLGVAGNKFTVWYKNEKAGSEWSVNAPVGAGTYEIALSRKTDDAYLKFDRTVLDGVRLKINKATLNLTGGNAFTTGGVVSIRIPDGIKGNGKIEYSILQFSGIGVIGSTQSTPVFKGVYAGTYSCTVSVGEGDNYLAVNGYSCGTVNVSGRKDIRYDVYLTITTGNNINAMTNKDVYGILQLTDGSEISKLLDLEDHDDFVWGKTDEYFICTVAAPWQIVNFRITCPKSDSLQVDKIMLHATKKDGSHRLEYVRDVSTEPIWIGESEYNDQYQCVDTFARHVYATGSFEDTAVRYVSLGDGAPSVYSYSYNGMTRDQYGTYYAMDYDEPPILAVSSGNNGYDSFVKFTGVSSFDIDLKGLTHYIGMNGGATFTYNVTLTKGIGSLNNLTPLRMSIVVNVPPELSFVLNEEVNPLVVVGGILSNPLGATASVGTPAPSVTDQVITAKRDDIIEVPVRVDADGDIWGILARAEYDRDAFELLEWTMGDTYESDCLTVQRDLGAEGFSFLAVNESLTDKSADGTLITLKFRVKDTAELQTYTITCNTVSSLRADGRAAPTGIGNAVVTVKGGGSPDTGDTSGIIMWIAAAVIGSGALLGSISRRRARRAVR